MKRYTSAMVIVCILWAFIGYCFTQRYLHGGNYGSVVGGIILVVIIVQIERQIILSINPTFWLYLARGIIACTMAITGAIIIDQIIFKEDIDLEKINSIEERVRKALPPKTEELRNQIASLDSAIHTKEEERLSLIKDVEDHPTTKVFSTQSAVRTEKRTMIDSVSGKPVVTERSSPQMVTVTSNMPNPQIERISPLENTIRELRLQKQSKDSALLNIRPALEKEISSKVGFLDELEVMYRLITRSNVAMIVWLLWFFFLFGLEMLVLISKVNEKESDYEKIVKHHMALQVRKLQAFARASEGE